MDAKRKVDLRLGSGFVVLGIIGASLFAPAEELHGVGPASWSDVEFLVPPMLAQTSGGEDAAPAPAYDILTTKRLTGDWGGARTSLEDMGITFGLTYQQQFMVNTFGGLETKNGHDFAGSYDGSLLLNFEKLGLVPGGEFFFRFKGTYGGDDSDFDREKIGGLFKTNADGLSEEPIYVDKWWWRQRLLDDRIEVRAGRLWSIKDLYDVSWYANSEDVHFLNQALSWNPVIPAINGLGLHVKAWPTDWLYVQGAAIDADAPKRRTGFDTAFHDRAHFAVFHEFGILPHYLFGELLKGNYRFGLWYNPREKTIYRDTLGGTRAMESRAGDVGGYFGFDQMVWKENSEPGDDQGLGVFGRFAAAHGDVNRLSHFWAAGAQYAGLIPTRDKDVLAFGVGQGILSETYRQELNPDADRETVYELYYKIQVFPWMVITPDVQLVTNPGAMRDGRDTLIAGIRMRVNF